nr:hypothetical protein [Tanacetum cinerariifolium]
EGTGGQVGREGRRVREPRRREVEITGEPEGQGNNQGVEVNKGVDKVLDFSTIIAQQLQNLLPTMLAQVGKQGSNQGDNRNQSGTVINENIQGDVRNVIMNNGRRGCIYKEFLAYNPKECDGKRGVIVYTGWIEKTESVQDMSGCGDDQKVNMAWDDFKALMREEFCSSKEMQKLETGLWNHVMVRAGHVAYTDRFHELARMVAATEPTTIQSVVLKAGVLTDEAIRNRSIKNNPQKRGNGGEPSKDMNVRDDNKRSRTVSAFAMTLFDSGANYSFVSTTFIPLLGIEPSDSGFSYKIEIASGIPLLDGKVLRMLGERPKGKVRYLMSVKAKEHKQEKIVIVRDFPDVFPDDLSGLPHIQEIKFWMELVPGAIPVVKSPYRLVPSELEELSGQLKELQDKDPSKIEAINNWEAPRTLSGVCSFLGFVSDYNYEIRYHPGKANVAADALSRKVRVKPKRVSAMNMTLLSNIKDMILAAQKEASDESAGL